jgi:hypothetical protein
MDLVEAEPAAKPEAPMFLQGEALYRYRFEPPARSSGGYVAEGAAAAFDFPAFQSIAASLDVFDLRLKANDGAIQIWETMLARYPRTPLRPLTLYRLGWAYRNRITAGFPRDDPNEPFQELLKNYPTSPLAPLAADAAKVARKSQDSATHWSIFLVRARSMPAKPGTGSHASGSPSEVSPWSSFRPSWPP